MRKPIFHLFIPGLLQHIEAWYTDFGFIADTPGLSKILNSFVVTTIEKVQGLDASFFSELGVVDEELPIAFNRQTNSEFKHGQTILCADPIHLEVGLNDVSLTEKITELSTAEADELLDVLNAHFKQDGLRFIRDQSPAQNHHWYLLVENSQPIRTTPINEVWRQNIAGKLPSSTDRNWQAIFNEIQMLLHSSEVNQQREMAGLTPINSLWLWGGGKPRKYQHNIHSIISTPESSGQTYALAAESQWHDLESLTSNSLNKLAFAEGTVAVILDQIFKASLHADLDAYQENLHRIESQYLQPVIELWQKNKIDIHITSCDGVTLQAQHKPRWKFWNKPKNMLQINKQIQSMI